jgi:hypothetical protein
MEISEKNSIDEIIELIEGIQEGDFNSAINVNLALLVICKELKHLKEWKEYEDIE